MSLVSSLILKVLTFSVFVVLCSSMSLVVRPAHSGVPDRDRSRITIGLGVLGYHRWGVQEQSSKKKGYGYEDQYPFHTHRKEDTSEELTPEDLARMPKNYRRIVESGGHLEDFKRYYMSDLYDEDMKQIEEERKGIRTVLDDYE
ncbi:hypothetical protein JTE90_029115 [Oedothorax gibbosus]|uniref:Uncharacterized protein n=1 Tax=Oedothorax gibbosus TaxID=931172 RepID=A0AAV6V9S5_9ARAC|nr:hypothetical protein JTE90_029115 [Oedothorax gibbosus]